MCMSWVLAHLASCFWANLTWTPVTPFQGPFSVMDPQRDSFRKPRPLTAGPSCWSVHENHSVGLVNTDGLATPTPLQRCWLSESGEHLYQVPRGCRCHWPGITRWEPLAWSTDNVALCSGPQAGERRARGSGTSFTASELPDLCMCVLFSLQISEFPWGLHEMMQECSYRNSSRSKPLRGSYCCCMIKSKKIHLIHQWCRTHLWNEIDLFENSFLKFGFLKVCKTDLTKLLDLIAFCKWRITCNKWHVTNGTMLHALTNHKC